MEVASANVQVKIVDSYLYKWRNFLLRKPKEFIISLLKNVENISSLFPNSLLRAVYVCYSALNILTQISLTTNG